MIVGAGSKTVGMGDAKESESINLRESVDEGGALGGRGADSCNCRSGSAWIADPSCSTDSCARSDMPREPAGGHGGELVDGSEILKLLGTGVGSPSLSNEGAPKEKSEDLIDWS